jgi:hypothetical protein
MQQINVYIIVKTETWFKVFLKQRINMDNLWSNFKNCSLLDD